jgi:hypothetical protein
MKKNNKWNIRRLVNEVIVPSTANYIEDCRIFSFTRFTMRHPVAKARVKLQRMTQNKCIGINFWKCTINTAPVKPLAQKTHSRLKKIGVGCKELFFCLFCNSFSFSMNFPKKLKFLCLVMTHINHLPLYYRKIASSNTSCLEAHVGFFRLLVKGIFGHYIL